MSFLRRMSSAASSFIPSIPSATGVPAPHVPRRPTETFSRTSKAFIEEEDIDEKASRASWELSDNESVSSKGSGSSNSGRSFATSSGSSDLDKKSFDESDDSSSDESDDSILDRGGRPRDRYDMMVRHLWNVAERQGWFRDADFDGLVSIRVKKRVLRTYPQPKNSKKGARELGRRIKEWDAAVSTLNPEVAMKITSKVVQAIMARCAEDSIEITLDVNTRIQILDDLSQLAGARKHQFAAFVRAESCLVVWADEVETLIPSAEALEQRMIAYVWSGRHHELKLLEPEEESEDEIDEKGADEEGWVDRDAEKEKELADADGDVDEEKVGGKEGDWEMRDRRPVMLYAPLVSGLAMILTFVFIGSGVRNLIKEVMLDGSYARLALIATSPFGYLLSIFFSICVMGNLWQIFGPVAQCHQNSSYYSGKAPTRMTGRLPHITIQMPVYKEGLEGVIIPTVESLKKAITTYERQGGSVNIFVFDDGMQLWDEEEQEIRKAYYDRNNIGWTARPKHGKDGFIRKGRFKKASNMNFGNNLSLRVEEIMDELRESAADEHSDPEWQWTDEDEREIYDEGLARALEESQGIAWAAGNIRIGELILIIDSDTRVPEDCFLDAASEFAQSPNIAIIQHESAVMQVVGHFFENGITSFTTRINTAISFCAANGEVAPFVGHNAFLRWAAIQDASFIDEDDGIRKCWSESHVSEDFDQALRCQMKGWSLRWASYSNGGFQEGVSLTADDELNRWQKYAYGCSELLFQPLRRWFHKGPITPLFNSFVWADGIPLHSKISVLAYISSYYAIACSLLLSLVNWVLIGLFDDVLDLFYLESWQVFLTCIVIFCGLSNISSALFQYRLNTNSLGNALVQNFKWIVFFFFFFCGMSWHLSTALCAHLTGYNMQWASTVKEVELSHFFKEWPAMWKRFWDIWIVSWVMILGVAFMASPLVPPGYRITNFTCILPLMAQACSHFLYPIVLNPWLLLFQF
ncbi:hypothetical protein I302_100705 [Kwoniella bestiolae CBS 10118]|uniref:Uncharacterized protein n=1 Tax=Kwoniella bestiolae CBS 10118 TaxID=1296100 RepID=A0A1B9G5T7_9TREE|nr:hypothetical protein I302_04080 [Kwoniella bestiolae CBS 10118]OCF26397.1 hypothetical protein I302_04080 [Kwoniella bestiolae CBS 10118]